MTVTLSEQSNGRISINSKSPAFKWEFGEHASCSKHDLFSVMFAIADFANNKCGEECIFDVE